MTKEERMEKLNKRMIEGQCDNWYHEFESNCREYSPNNSLIYIRGGINLESIDGRFKRARESWSLLNCEMKEFCNKWQSHFKFIEKRKINFGSLWIPGSCLEGVIPPAYLGAVRPFSLPSNQAFHHGQYPKSHR